MDKIIQNMPNNMVAIICTVKAIDKNNDNYAIIPQEVSFGKIDESNCELSFFNNAVFLIFSDKSSFRRQEI